MDNKCVIDWVNEKVDFDVGNEKMALVGTCNGLVCLGSKSGCLFIIWNPITREFYKYKDPEIAKFTREDCRVTWGFGYVSAVDDYKIVRITEYAKKSVKTGEGILTLLKDHGETEEIILPRNLVGSMLYDNLIGFIGANKVFIQYCGSYADAPCLGAIDMTSRPLTHTRLMILEAETKSEVVSYCPSLVSPNVLTIPTDRDSNL
ncbi:uncharacterized protein LOC141608638 [Silene latifolia]|uniref:uncharacterized protein LOC141608638 n=1 Tax=Silene latifolia TaxID=37657 RepID=UPI003D77A033